MEQKFAICRVAISPVRVTASDKAEISTQLFFGDAVEILERAESWWHIRNAYDGYEGWADFKQLTVVTEEVWQEYLNFTVLTPLEVTNTITAEDGSHYYLPAGSSLPKFAEGVCGLGAQQFKVLFKPHIVVPASSETIIKSAMFYLNAPYMWGGRTIFGIDCSGFSQTVYKLSGIPIKRDASQQAEQGKTVNFLPEVQPGDLAFFDNANGRIVHVGIMLNSSQIIHASGRVRIDPIDDQGIYNHELGRYTHQLRIIKRFL